MIATSIDAAAQLPESPAIEKALRFLRDARACPPADGRTAIDGEKIYAMIQSYESRDRTAPTFEAHRRYIDLQYILEGREVIGWSPIEYLSITDPYSEDKDVMLGKVEPIHAALMPAQTGRLFVLFPEDAHAPGLAIDRPEPVRKIVVKVQATLMCPGHESACGTSDCRERQGS